MDVKRELQKIEKLMENIKKYHNSSMSEHEDVLFNLATIRVEIDLPGIIFRFLENIDRDKLIIDLNECKKHFDNSILEDKLRSKNIELIEFCKCIDSLINYIIKNLRP
ncbi:hypothetical protein MCEREM21A_01382 [Sphingomonadaceae bacterium]|jgi:hypothetical protein